MRHDGDGPWPPPERWVEAHDLGPPSRGAHVAALLILLGIPVPIVIGLLGDGWHAWAVSAITIYTAAFLAAVYGGWSQGRGRAGKPDRRR